MKNESQTCASSSWAFVFTWDDSNLILFLDRAISSSFNFKPLESCREHSSKSSSRKLSVSESFFSEPIFTTLFPISNLWSSNLGCFSQVASSWILIWLKRRSARASCFCKSLVFLSISLFSVTHCSRAVTAAAALASAISWADPRDALRSTSSLRYCGFRKRAQSMSHYNKQPAIS